MMAHTLQTPYVDGVVKWAQEVGSVLSGAISYGTKEKQRALNRGVILLYMLKFGEYDLRKTIAETDYFDKFVWTEQIRILEHTFLSVMERVFPGMNHIEAASMMIEAIREMLEGVAKTDHPDVVLASEFFLGVVKELEGKSFVDMSKMRH